MISTMQQRLGPLLSSRLSRTRLLCHRSSSSSIRWSSSSSSPSIDDVIADHRNQVLREMRLSPSDESEPFSFQDLLAAGDIDEPTEQSMQIDPRERDDDAISVDETDQEYIRAQALEARLEARRAFMRDEHVRLAFTEPYLEACPPVMVNRANYILQQQNYTRRQHMSQKQWTQYLHEQVLNGSAVYSRERSLEYLCNEMPMSFSVIRRVLHETKRLLAISKHDQTIDSLLDFGAGTGAGVFAADDVFGDSLKQFVCVEPAPFMRELGENMLNDESESSKWISTLPGEVERQHSIVMASFVLREIPESQRINVIDHLWRSAKHALVIIDLGNAEGSASVLEARRQILSKYANDEHDRAGVLAPCPHSEECPWAKKFELLLESTSKRKQRRREKQRNFCHFGQRVPLKSFPTSSFMHVRETSASRLRFQHEHMVPFSYAVLHKESGSSDSIGEEESSAAVKATMGWSRLIKPPLKRGGHVVMDMCHAKGEIQRDVISKSKGQNGPYRLARKLQWADRWPYSKDDIDGEKLSSSS